MIQPQAVRVDIYGQTRRRRTYWVYLTPDGEAFLDAVDAYTHTYNCVGKLMSEPSPRLIDAYTHAYNCVQQPCKRAGSNHDATN